MAATKVAKEATAKRASLENMVKDICNKSECFGFVVEDVNRLKNVLWSRERLYNLFEIPLLGLLHFGEHLRRFYNLNTVN